MSSVTIGGQTFIKTPTGWVDKKTKQPAPEGLTTLLNNISEEESPEGKKKRVRIDRGRPVIKLGSSEYVYDLNDQVWIDKKTKTPADPKFSKIIEGVFQSLDEWVGVDGSIYDKSTLDAESLAKHKRKEVKDETAKSVISSVGMIGQAGGVKQEVDADKIQSTPISKGFNSSIVKMIDQLVILDGYIDQGLKNKIIKENNKKLDESEEGIEKGGDTLVSAKKMPSKSSLLGLGLLGAAGLAMFASQISDAFAPVVDAVKGVGEFATSIYEKIASAFSFSEKPENEDAGAPEKAAEQKPSMTATDAVTLVTNPAGYVGLKIAEKVMGGSESSTPATPPPADAVKETKKKVTHGYASPVDGASISSGYGMRDHPTDGVKKFHTGIDFSAPSGTPVKAAKSGIVTKAEFGRPGSGYNDFGHTVVVDHGDGFQTVYAHLSGYAAKKGDKVSAGQTIGYVGNTGKSTGAHLHFMVQKSGLERPTEKNTVNPMTLLQGGKLEVPIDTSSSTGTPTPSTQAQEKEKEKKEENVFVTLAKTIGMLASTLIGPGKIRNINASLQNIGSTISAAEMAKNSSIAESKTEMAQETLAPSPPNINTPDLASIENPPTLDDKSSVFYYLKRFGYEIKTSSLSPNLVVA